MRQEGHLQVFDLTLKTNSPLFIGSGRSDSKKEYIFDSRKNEVIFLDERKLFTYLAEHNLADDYEGYILRNTSRNLRDFLQNVCRIPKAELEAMIRVRISAADALDDNHTLKEIHRFVRNGRGEVYVPGSSIKGALRMALLKAQILEDPDSKTDIHAPFDEIYFHTLNLKKDKFGQRERRNAMNSILQGVRISDSEPIPDKHLCLTTKIDEFTDGTYNVINLCRESIKPGVEIRCSITLDQSVLKGRITKERLLEAIGVASKHYRETVVDRYEQVASYMNSRTILMGGGVGFQSKTIIGAACPERELKLTAAILNEAFPKHNHKVRDPEEGISPRALKQTDYNRASYPYGVCEVYIQ